MHPPWGVYDYSGPRNCVVEAKTSSVGMASNIDFRKTKTSNCAAKQICSFIDKTGENSGNLPRIYLQNTDNIRFLNAPTSVLIEQIEQFIACAVNPAYRQNSLKAHGKVAEILTIFNANRLNTGNA